ncbi:MAG: sterol desaturase family protein [Mycobacteriales bacterium]|nr:sterol desaturase family protein [Mycobacteriales bacterium]
MTEDVRTLRQAARRFVGHSSPWALAGALAVGLAGALSAGPTAGQLLVVVTVLAAQPVVEWVIHVVVLHARPLTVGGRTVDLYQARKHRAHHAAPRDLDILLIPLRGHLAGAAVVGALCLALPGAATRWALVAAVAATSLAYEWVHFLVHTDYKPRRAAYRRLYVHHRLHHYRNEHYWFGVSRIGADRLFGTAPAKTDVERSDTVLTLGL